MYTVDILKIGTIIIISVIVLKMDHFGFYNAIEYVSAGCR